MYKLDKPYNSREEMDFITKYNHNQGLRIEETEEALIALEPWETIIDGQYINKEDEYNQKKAEGVRTWLVESCNYPLKEEIAYTGVFFDYNGEEVVFETNKDSMGLVNFTLTQLLLGTITEVANWKCRRTVKPYSPVSVTFTKEQFNTIIGFAGVMLSSAFNVEKEINEKIKVIPAEQLLVPEFVKGIEAQMKEAYAKVPRKIENLFPVEPEVPEEVPEKEPPVTVPEEEVTDKPEKGGEDTTSEEPST